MDNKPECSRWAGGRLLMDADEHVQLRAAVAENVRQTLQALYALKKPEEQRDELYREAKERNPPPWSETAGLIGLSVSLETFLPQGYFDAGNRPSFFDRRLADVGKWEPSLLSEGSDQA
jgi:hypothetical protein